MPLGRRRVFINAAKYRDTRSKNIAQRIQLHLSNINNVPKVTASFAITKYIENEALNELLNRADKALYKAKESGKNRIEQL